MVIRKMPRDMVNVTCTSPIPLFFSAGGDAPKLIPHSLENPIGEGSEVLKGETEADILVNYHVDTPELQMHVDISNGLRIISFWNLGVGWIHFWVQVI